MPWLVAFAYILIFFSLVAAAIAYQRRVRKDRKPFPDNLLLLRAPGETLRRRANQLSEDLLWHFLAALSIPLVVSFVFLWITTELTGSLQIFGLVTTAIALPLSLFLAIRRVLNLLKRWRNHELGYFGERIVGEALDDLKAQGFRVFHDVPAGDPTKPFNLDHVIVGPSGVFAIETKTRRKSSARTRAGFAEHQIIFDGQVLAYPWGEDRHGLAQAQSQARWLEIHLETQLGQRTPVSPILTFPGWMILRRGDGPVSVLNPREIPAAVAHRGQPVLDDRQRDLINRLLDARCRDVEF